MAGGVSSLVGALLDLVYPRSCAGCGLPVDLAAGHLCWDCLSGFERVTHPFCEICGDPVDGNVAHRYTCSWCVRAAPAFDRARSALRYRGRLHAAVYALKYGGASCVAGDFSAFLAGCARAHYGAVLLDAVAAVPLHARRLRERSYNQSALLAAGVARKMGLGLARRCLSRSRDTASQTNLSASERRRNVRGAFRVTDPAWVEGRRFLLVDDVMTTGATVNECARVLKSAGAVSVHVVTLARG